MVWIVHMSTSIALWLFIQILANGQHIWVFYFIDSACGYLFVMQLANTNYILVEQ